MAESKATPEKVQALKIATSDVIREWASLEMTLSLVLSGLLKTDQFRARVVWSSLANWRARRELLLRLGNTFLDESALPQWRGLLKRAKTLGEKRNELAHMGCGIDPKTGKVTFIGDGTDDELGFNFLIQKRYDLNNVLGWAPAIQTLMSDVATFQAALHTSPKMHRAAHPHPPQSGTPRPSTPKEP